MKKERKIMVTIEALSNIPLKEFSKKSIQEMFDQHFTDVDGYKSNKETFTVHQVRAQVVRPEK